MGDDHSIDPDKVHHLVHTGAVGAAFARLDRQLAAVDESLTVELAEDTYSWLHAIAPLHLADATTTQATLYLNRSLTELQDAAPDSDFSTLSVDTANDAYELVYPAVTLRLKFDTRHSDCTTIETEFAAITVAVPTMDAYRERTVEALDEQN